MRTLRSPFCILMLATFAASTIANAAEHDSGVLFKECSRTSSSSSRTSGGFRVNRTGEVGNTAQQDGSTPAASAERTETYLWMSQEPEKENATDSDKKAKRRKLVCKTYTLPMDEQKPWPEGSYTDVSSKKFAQLQRLCERQGRHHQNKTTAGRKSLKGRLDYWVQSFFIYPGTLWCGKGNRARKFEDLGKHRQEDACCREHDQCKVTIHPGSCLHDKMAVDASKQYFCNKTPIMMSHCECDLRFHHCLQHLNTSTAYTIGNLYFNVVSARCFGNGVISGMRGALQAYTINFPKLAWGSQLYDMASSLFTG